MPFLSCHQNENGRNAPQHFPLQRIIARPPQSLPIPVAVNDETSSPQAGPSPVQDPWTINLLYAEDQKASKNKKTNVTQQDSRNVDRKSVVRRGDTSVNTAELMTKQTELRPSPSSEAANAWTLNELYAGDHRSSANMINEKQCFPKE